MDTESKRKLNADDELLSRLDLAVLEIHQSAEHADKQATIIEEKAREFRCEIERIKRRKTCG